MLTAIPAGQQPRQADPAAPLCDDPGDVDGEGRPCRDCIFCGRPRLDGIRYCEECARYLRLRRLGVPAATIVGMVERYCNYGADRFDRDGYRAALEALVSDARSG